LLLLPRTILASLALIIVAGYYLIPHSIVQNTSIYSAASIRQIPPRLESIALLCGTASLVLVAVCGYLGRLKKTGQILLLLFVGVQMVLLLQYGTWIKKKKDTPTLAQMVQAKKKSLSYRSATGYGLANAVVIRQVQRSFLEPFLGRIYSSYRIAKNNEMAYALMEQEQSPEQVTIEQYTLKQSLPVKKKSGKGLVNGAKLVFSSFNRLVFEVQCAEMAFFGLAYPYTGHWQAYGNDQKLSVYRANGAYHAVEVPAGISRLEFRYWSTAAFWGMVISCATLIIIGFSIGVVILKNPAGFAVFVVALFLGAGGFGLWFQSLYRGVNLNTEYHWQERPAALFPNLAYGKRTYMSSLLYPNYVYHRNSGQAVDGIRIPESGFITDLQSKPWWVIDLHQPIVFDSIVIFESKSGPEFNKRPLLLSISIDGKKWHTVGSISERNLATPLHITTKTQREARYVLLKASGTCRLSFDEVEIYRTQTTQPETQINVDKLEPVAYTR
jgi:hypothetical protein